MWPGPRIVLKVLRLSDNPITDLSPLAGLTALETLQLLGRNAIVKDEAHCPTTGPDALVMFCEF